MKEELLWAAGLAGRLRESLEEIAEETPPKRYDFFKTEIRAALEPVPPERREMHLRALQEFFPDWMQVREVPVPVPVKAPPPQTAQELATALAAQVRSLSAERREEIARQLEQAGLDLTVTVPVAAPEGMLGPGKERALRHLRAFAIVADELCREHWKKLEPVGKIFQGTTLVKEAVDGTLKGKEAEDDKRIKEALRRLLATMDLLLSYLTTGGESSPVWHLANEVNNSISPDLIEGLYERPSQRWEEYRKRFEVKWGNLEWVVNVFRVGIVKLTDKPCLDRKLPNVSTLFDLEMR